MKTCSHCGVRVEEKTERCPLCHARIDGASVSEGAEQSEREENLIDERPRIWLIEFVSLLVGVAALVVFAADFAVGFSLSWSRFPLSAFVYAWFMSVAIIVLGRRPVLLWLALTAATSLFLAAINLFAGGGAWFLPLALPLVLLAAVLVGVVIWFSRSRGLSALPIISLSVGTAGVYVVGLELILDSFLQSSGRPGWSFVALALGVSLSLVLVFVHSRLRRRNASLERVFHL